MVKKNSRKVVVKKKVVFDSVVKPYIMDYGNITALGVILNPDSEVVSMVGLDKLFFKRIGDVSILNVTGDMDKFFLPDKSRYGYEWLKYAKKLFKLLRDENDISVWQGWDSKKRTWIKDYPVLLRSNDVGFIIAPRIEKE